MKKISIALLTLLVAIAACKKVPEVNTKYVDVEREVLTLGATKANIQCDYEYMSTLKNAKLYYGETEDAMSSVDMRVMQSSLYAEITGLESEKSYKYYYEFYNGFNSMRSGVMTFVTPSPSAVMLPTVITADITEITVDSARCGGEVIDGGGGRVTERGICWSFSYNPSVTDSRVVVGEGTGAFSITMDSLEENTIYHVRAYATNAVGTAYGLEKIFRTPKYGEAPTGAIFGLFTVNANGDQVYFAQGNLQYQASTNTWRLAENQWDYVGGIEDDTIEFGNVYENGIKCQNQLISSGYSGWIDLFGWSTYNNPTNYSTTYADYPTSFVDWSVNTISNGGENNWFTMTNRQWEYIIYRRTTPSGIRYAYAQVNGVNGLLLLPDNWDSANIQINNPNAGGYGGTDSGGPYESNIITANDWKKFKRYGVVFCLLQAQEKEETYSVTNAVVIKPLLIFLEVGRII